MVLYFDNMKKMFALSAAIFLFTHLSAQDIGLVLMSKFPPAIKGNPVMVTGFHYNKLRPEAGVTKTLSWYNTAGMLVKTEQYEKDGLLSYQKECINDTINNRVLHDIVTFQSHGEIFTDTNFYTYDSKGFLVRQVEKFSDSSRITEYTNDDKGFPVKSLAYDTKGRLYEKETAKYDYDKNVVKVNVHAYRIKKKYSREHKIDRSKPNGKRNDNREKFNEQGDRIAYESLGRHGRITKVAEYVYDQNGNWISMKWYILVPLPNTLGKETRELESESTREFIYRD